MSPTQCPGNFSASSRSCSVALDDESTARSVFGSVTYGVVAEGEIVISN